MTFEIEAGGRRRHVDVRRADDGWVVTVDSIEVAVDWKPAAGGRGSLLLGTRSYEIAIDDSRDVLHVHVDGVVVPVTVADPRRGWTRARSDRGGDGPRRVTAPMAGRIVKVLVKPGETVTPKHGLVVVEAMKMENELRSPKGGTVTEVKVTEGMSVEAGTLLVVVE